MRSAYLAIFVLAVLSQVVITYGANVSASSNSVATGNSTIAVNTSIVVPNYQSSIDRFLIYTFNGNSSYSTVDLLNQSSFTAYNMSVKLLNSSGYPPFLGEILILPTTFTPNGVYRIDMKVTGGNPSGFVQGINVTILNRSYYSAYQNTTKLNRGIQNGTYATSTAVTHVTTASPTTVQQGTSVQSSFYTVNSSIAPTTAAGGQISGGPGAQAYVAVLVIIAIIVAAYLIMRSRNGGGKKG